MKEPIKDEFAWRLIKRARELDEAREKKKPKPKKVDRKREAWAVANKIVELTRSRPDRQLHISYAMMETDKSQYFIEKYAVPIILKHFDDMEYLDGWFISIQRVHEGGSGNY